MCKEIRVQSLRWWCCNYTHKSSSIWGLTKALSHTQRGFQKCTAQHSGQNFTNEGYSGILSINQKPEAPQVMCVACQVFSWEVKMPQEEFWLSSLDKLQHLPNMVSFIANKGSVSALKFFRLLRWWNMCDWSCAFIKKKKEKKNQLKSMKRLGWPLWSLKPTHCCSQL